MIGKILNLKSKKTACVLIKKIKKKNKYGKKILINKKILTHYECSFFKKKMIVKILKKPNISKKKNWIIYKILK
ncbi:30S ribosomal protein S17 [Candidatus Vidania fulgoroideorum]